MGLIHFQKTVLKNLFSKPVTRDYPKYKKVFNPTTRGHVVIDIDSCIFCGLCSRKCPAEAITVDRKEKSWAILRARCVQCNSCVEACPKKCLDMKPEYSAVMTKKEMETYHARVPDHETDH